MIHLTERNLQVMLKECDRSDVDVASDIDPHYGVFTCEADDKVGLSARVTSLLQQQKISIARWNAAAIGGLYQMRCLVFGEAARLRGLRSLYRSALYGLSPRLIALAPRKTHTIDFICPDAHGVAAKVLQTLADERINVVWDDKLVRNAAATATLMFSQNMIVNRETGLSSDELEDIIRALEDELGGRGIVIPGVRLKAQYG